MILKNLRITLMDYGQNKDKYVGTAEFTGDTGTVNLNLTPAHCEQIFRVCADGILSTAKEAASNLTTAVIEHQRQIAAL